MGEIHIETPDGLMPAAVSEPDGAARGAVIVLQEAFGLTPHIVDITRRLAAEGWLAVAPALFHRQGSPAVAYDDFASIRPVFESLRGDDMLADVHATLSWLADRDVAPDSMGMVGFCMGGSVTQMAATRFDFGAAVTFYGGGLGEARFGFPPLVEVAPTLQVPWLGLYGDLDTGIPIDAVEALRVAAATAPVPTEVVRYPDAQHGFHCDERSSFHAASAADAWARALAWFERYLGS